MRSPEDLRVQALSKFMGTCLFGTLRRMQGNQFLASEPLDFTGWHLAEMKCGLPAGALGPSVPFPWPVTTVYCANLGHVHRGPPYGDRVRALWLS